MLSSPCLPRSPIAAGNDAPYQNKRTRFLVNKLNRYEAGLSRSALCRTILGVIAGCIIGTFFAGPVLGYFRKFTPWVRAAVIVGIVGLVMVAMLLLPLVLKPRANKDK